MPALIEPALCAFVLALLLPAGAFCAELSLPSTPAGAGYSVLLPVNFASQSASVAGIEFDLQYDASAFTLGVTVGDVVRSATKTLYQFDLAPGQKRILIIGLGANPLVDGTLVNLFVSVGVNTPAGTYPIKFLNALGADTLALFLPITTFDGAVTVQGAGTAATRLNPSGVLNAASMVPGPVAPGEILTLIGAGIGPVTPQRPTGGSPTSAVLASTSVLFDSTPAPLLYAGPGQINLIAPFVIGQRASTDIQIMQGSQTLADLGLAVTAVSPAIFTLDGSGVGQGAILNQDSTVNSPSAPALRGSVIVLYASGAGQTDPPSTDGQITGAALAKPLLPVAATIGGVDAKVLYASAAPGMVAGMLQVNCVVPLDASAGYAVPVLISVGGVSSPAGVTVSIQ